MTRTCGPPSTIGCSNVETTVDAENVPRTRSTSSPVLRRPCGAMGGTTATWFAEICPTSSPTRASPVPCRMTSSSSALSQWTGSTAPGSSSNRTVAVLAVPVALWTGNVTRKPGAVVVGSKLSISKVCMVVLLSMHSSVQRLVPDRLARVKIRDTLLCNETKVSAQGARAAPGRDEAADRRRHGRPPHLDRPCEDDRLRDRLSRRGRTAHGVCALPGRGHPLRRLHRALDGRAPAAGLHLVTPARRARGAAGRRALRPLRVVRERRARPRGVPAGHRAGAARRGDG